MCVAAAPSSRAADPADRVALLRAGQACRIISTRQVGVPDRKGRALPTYQYACTECGHGFEAVQSFTDDALTVCPQCTGRLRKVFNSVGIVFKGSGFYRTDSREKPKDGAASGKDSAGSAQPDSPKTGSDGSGAGAKDGASTG